MFAKTFQSRMFSKLTRDPTGDAGFKAIFKIEKNMKHLLEAFVATGKIEELTYLPNPVNEKHGGAGMIRFDVLVKDCDGSSYIVEVQNATLVASSAQWIYSSTSEYYEQARVNLAELIRFGNKDVSSMNFYRPLKPVHSLVIYDVEEQHDGKSLNQLLSSDKVHTKFQIMECDGGGRVLPGLTWSFVRVDVFRRLGEKGVTHEFLNYGAAVDWLKFFSCKYGDEVTLKKNECQDALVREAFDTLALPLEGLSLEEQRGEPSALLQDVVMRAEQAYATEPVTRYVRHCVATMKALPTSHELAEMFDLEIQEAINILREVDGTEDSAK